MAALIEQATGVAPAVVEGSRSEFSVAVGGRIVAQKGPRGFPTDDEVIAAVRGALAGPE